MRRFHKLLVSLLVLCCLQNELCAITLRTGLNLVSFHLQPADPSPSAVFAPVLSRVKFVAGLDEQTGNWRHYFPTALGHPAFLNTLTEIEPGRGYVVQLTPGVQVNLPVTGTLPTTETQRSFATGWNLVGTFSQVRRFWADLFSRDAFSVLQIRGACNGTSFWGFTLDSPPFGKDANGNNMLDISELRWFYASDTTCGINPPLRQLDVDLGYWVKLAAPVTFGPQLALYMPSDPNNGSEAVFPEPVDEDFNMNGLLDYGYSVWNGFDYELDTNGRPIKATQDTIVFRIPKGAAYSDVTILGQQIMVGNVGDRGNSAVYGYGGNDALAFEIQMDPGMSDWLEVEPVTGSVGASGDLTIVNLSARIDDLEPGTISSGNLTFLSNGGNRTVTVRIEVPFPGGLYDGSVFTWLGDAASESDSMIRRNRPMRITLDVAGGTGMILKEHTPHIEQDINLEVTYLGNNMFTASNASNPLVVADNDPNNLFGVTYQRVITIEGQRRNDDATAYGNQPPIQGTYSEVVSGLGTDLMWSGKFLLLQLTEPQ